MKILLIEDHRMMATSLKQSLEQVNIEVDVVDNIDNIVSTIIINNYDLVFIDINLKGLTKKENGLELSKILISQIKGIKIAILTGYNLKYYQEVARDIGCYGFISKEEETKSLLRQLKMIVEENKKVFPNTHQEMSKLTKNEVEIVRLYASGMTRKDVAAKTYMSISSLAVSLNRIYSKLGVTNYQQMSDKARELGYIDSF